MLVQVKRSWIAIVLGIMGLAAIVLTLFARQLGLAHGLSWGGGRISLFVFGIVLFFGSCLLYDARWLNNKVARAYLIAGLCILFIAAIYLWFSTTGLWIQWPSNNDSSTIYDQLATSFLAGKIDLPIQPDPVLLHLSDPYDPSLRTNIPQLDAIWDMSLYDGKVYVYWGPVPALLMIFLKYFIPGPIGDQILVFGFVLGLLIFQSLLILYLWYRFYSSLPEWVLIVPLLVAGLAEPLLWILNEPRVYEAAIVADQFFFVGGLYFVVTALNRHSFSIARLFLAGLFFTSSVGSRATMAIPVIFIFLAVVWWILFSGGHLSKIKYSVGVLAAFSLPLMAGAGILGWYNWARFGSPLEFGFRYQISRLNLYKDYGATFLPRYLPPNLYIYLLNPPGTSKNFPFIKPVWDYPLMIAFNNHYSPPIYHAERVVGMLYSAPLMLLFILLLLVSFLWKRRNSLQQSNQIETQFHERFLSWIVVILFGTCILAFGTELLFFYAATRYLLDAFPVLALIASIGFWEGYQLLRRSSIGRILYSGLVSLLTAESMGMAMMIAFASNLQRFQDNNPELYKGLVRFLTLLMKRFQG